jgi:hypothetical protein
MVSALLVAGATIPVAGTRMELDREFWMIVER